MCDCLPCELSLPGGNFPRHDRPGRRLPAESFSLTDDLIAGGVESLILRNARLRKRGVAGSESGPPAEMSHGDGLMGSRSRAARTAEICSRSPPLQSEDCQERCVLDGWQPALSGRCNSSKLCLFNVMTCVLSLL